MNQVSIYRIFTGQRGNTAYIAPTVISRCPRGDICRVTELNSEYSYYIPEYMISLPHRQESQPTINKFCFVSAISSDIALGCNIGYIDADIKAISCTQGYNYAIVIKNSSMTPLVYTWAF